MNDRVALITGGGTGIGAATARLFAEAGVAVCVTGRRQAPLDEVVAAVREAGGRAQAVTGDVAVTADCQRMVDEAASAFGQVDILVNNAGTATLMDADETTDELWDQTIGTNLSGAFRLIRTVLPAHGIPPIRLHCQRKFRPRAVGHEADGGLWRVQGRASTS